MMKRVFLLVALLLFGCGLIIVTPAFSDTYWGSFYKTGSADSTSEEGYLEEFLSGVTATIDCDPYFVKKEDPTDDTPGVDWTWAMVKWANYYYIFKDDNLDNNVLEPEIGNSAVLAALNSVDGKNWYNWLDADDGSSHASYFGCERSVPEPQTMFLLGVGLIGLAGVGRKKLR